VDKKLKITHIITRLILGGAQENTLLTCEGLHQQDHAVTLITGKAVGEDAQLMARAQSGGYRVIEVKPLIREIHPLKDWLAYRQIKKHLRQLNPDIVHTHSAKAGVLGRLAAWNIRQSKVQSCCSIKEKVDAEKSKTTGTPRIIHTIHGLPFHPYQPAWKNKIYIAAERAAAKRCDLLISVAQAMTDQALAQNIGQSEQYVKIFSGMETKDFLNPPPQEKIAEIKKKYNLPDNALIIATVARLFELKGHEDIIESAKTLAPRHPHVIWLFIGDGNLKSPYQNQIKTAGLSENFRFTGLVDPKEIGPMLHTSDILVHCSLREGLARALPQALLCGKPVISFDVDGAREVVQNDKTGFLIAPKNISGLIDAQEKLIADPSLRKRLGQNGRELCQDEFDHRTMTDKIERLYQTPL
jgi:glycosyltransferase involved in cell wall biosynthesis